MNPECTVCGGSRTIRLFVKGGVPYWRCRACQFRFATPPTNPNLSNDLADFEPSYLQYLDADPTDEVNFADTRRWIEQFTPLAGKTVLDIGAGGGKWVRWLRRQGIEAYGVEPSDALFTRFLRDDSAFAHGTLSDDLALSQRTFDVLTAFDVLEHVERPVEFLQQAAARLNPGGALFLSTPDVGSPVARALGSKWHFYCAYHLSYFDQQTLARLASQLGLQPLDSRYRGRRRSLGYAARYFFEFLLRRRSPGWVRRLETVTAPVNLHDTMHVCLRRAG